jgi:hypothetical protein
MHPVTSDRIKKATAEMSEILPDREVYLLNTSEFDMVKRRALDLQDAIQGGEASGGPTLRRRTKSSKTDGPMADSQIPASHPDTPPPR